MTTTTSTTSNRAAPPVARFAGWAGIAFAVTFVAGFITVAQVPAYDAADADWVAWVAEDNVLTVIGTLLLTAAGLLLMAFITSLASHVRGPVASEHDHEVAVLRGAGIMAGTTLLIAALIGGAMSAGVTFAPNFEAPGAELIRSLDQLSLGLMLVGTGWSTAVTVALTSWTGRRSATLPGWLTTAGFVAAAALLLSPMFLPIVLLPLWVLITSITVLRADR
jgi:hypothetical protein